MTPLLLLPGMMCDGRLFEPQIARFGGEREVQVPRLAPEQTVEALAGRMLAEAPARFALAGLSMGGIVAMEMLRQAPDRVDRIALLDTNHRAELPAVAARRGPQMEAATAGQLDRVMREEMKPNYLADGPNRRAILDICMDMALDLGPEVFLAQSQALMTRPDQTETLAGANLPALVLCGETDTLCPVSRHEEMAGLISGAELVIVPGAGHLPTLEQPEATNGALVDWLSA